MHFKKGTIEALKGIFSYCNRLDTFESRMSFEEFKKEFLEYSGNEAEILREYWYKCKCRRVFSQGRTTPSCVNGHLPDDFYSEWDATTKDFERLFLGIYLTQEFFETDPSSTLQYGFNCFQNFPSPSTPIGRKFRDIENKVRSLEEIKSEYRTSLKHLKILKSMQEEDSLIRSDGFFTSIKEEN